MFEFLILTVVCFFIYSLKESYFSNEPKDTFKKHIPNSNIPINQSDESQLSLAIKKAISSGSRLKISYRDLDGVLTTRTISPKVLFRTQYTDELALSSYCHLRDEERTFMVSRVLELEFID